MRDLINIVESTVGAISPEDAQVILNDRYCKHGVKIAPSARLWRGVSDHSGSGMAVYGLGLYFTVDRKTAAHFAGDDGEIIEISRTQLPDNALRFDTTNDFQIWVQNAMKVLGFTDKRDFGAVYHDFADFIRALDPTIEGIQMFTGRDAMFVLYP